jgi:general secretion pathway protein H
MRTSGPGSSRQAAPPGLAGAAGFTLIELLVVLAIVAIAVSVVSLAVRDSTRERLEREAQRLAALLEMARAESRATAWPVAWVPARDSLGAAVQRFRFVGLSQASTGSSNGLGAERFLEAGVRLQILVAGGEAPAVRLGPEAILPPQRVVLSLDGQRIEVASDGIEAFAVRNDAGEAGSAGNRP